MRPLWGASKRSYQVIDQDNLKKKKSAYSSFFSRSAIFRSKHRGTSNSSDFPSASARKCYRCYLLKINVIKVCLGGFLLAATSIIFKRH